MKTFLPTQTPRSCSDPSSSIRIIISIKQCFQDAIPLPKFSKVKRDLKTFNPCVLIAKICVYILEVFSSNISTRTCSKYRFPMAGPRKPKPVGLGGGGTRNLHFFFFSNKPNMKLHETMTSFFFLTINPIYFFFKK